MAKFYHVLKGSALAAGIMAATPSQAQVEKPVEVLRTTDSFSHQTTIINMTPTDRDAAQHLYDQINQKSDGGPTMVVTLPNDGKALSNPTNFNEALQQNGSHMPGQSEIRIGEDMARDPVSKGRVMDVSNAYKTPVLDLQCKTTQDAPPAGTPKTYSVSCKLMRNGL